MKKYSYLIFTLFFIKLGFATSQLTLEVRKSERNLERLIFNSSEVTNIDYQTDGVRLRINFETDVNLANPHEIKTSDFVDTIRNLTSRSLILTFREDGYNFRKFIGNGYVGIDIIRNPNAVVPLQPTNETQARTAIADTPSKVAVKKPHLVPKPRLRPDAVTILPAINPEKKIKELPKKEKERLIVTKTDLGTRMEFLFEDLVAASIFNREGYLWIIFNKHQEFELDKIKDLEDVSLVQQIPNSFHTIIRIKSNKLNNALVKRIGFDWVIDFTENPIARKIAPNHLFSIDHSNLSDDIIFFGHNTANPFRVTDPAIGDELSIVSSYLPDHGIATERSFTDFVLLPTMQGFVTQILIDGVEIDKKGDNIVISSPIKDLYRQLVDSNSSISSTFTLRDFPGANKNGTSLIGFDNWKSAEDPKFFDNYEKLVGDLSAGKDRQKARFSLASFYFSRGYNKEAISLLEYLTKDDPKTANNPSLQALLAAAYYQEGEHKRAQEIYENIDFNYLRGQDLTEVKFWHKANNIELEQSDEPLNYISLKENFLKNYPLKLQHQFALTEMRAAVKRKDFTTVNTIRDMLTNESDDPRLVNSAEYLQGALELAMGNDLKAAQIWNRVAAREDDTYNYVRSRLAVIKLMHELNDINAEEAEKQLEELRGKWHGGEVEIEMIDLLAELNLQQKKYREALIYWRDLIVEFPDNVKSLQTASKMGEIFKKIFTDKEADNLSDLEAVSLYYEFRELTPIGKAGDEVALSLVNRLERLDLLDRAASLLEHLVKYRLRGEERINSVMQLANIHMDNQAPEIALALLNRFTDQLDPNQVRKFDILKAKAYIALSDYQTAEDILSNIGNTEAEDLKLNIYWKREEWGRIKDHLSLQLGELYRGEGILAKRKAEKVLQLAIAENILNNDDNLQKLRELFSERMPTEDNLRQEFLFITRVPDESGAIDVDKTMSTTTIEKFVKNFREEIDTERPGN